MRKYLSIFLVAIMIVAQISGISFADDTSEIEKNVPTSVTDIIIKEATMGKTPIKEGDEFTLTIELEKKTKYKVSSLMIGIEKSSNFRVKDSGSKKSIESDSESLKVDFNLIYNGGDDIQLPVIIFYTLEDPEKDAEKKLASSSATIEDYISISKAVPTSSLPPEKEPEKIDESKFVPNISIISSKTIQAESGETISVPIDIKNISDNSAFDISATLELAGDSPISIVGSGHASISRLLSGRTDDMRFRISLDEFAENKTYPLKISLQYYNQYGVPFSSTDNVYIKVTNNSTDASIVVNRIDIKPSEVQPGNPVMAGFEIENIGDSIAKDVKVSLKGLSNDGFSLVAGTNNQTIPLVEKGKTRYVFFQLKPSIKMAAGNHELEMMLSYKNIKNQEIIDENKFFIPISSTRSQASNIIIENLTYTSGGIGINKEADISFNIRNQGQADAKNIVIEAKSEDQSGLVPKTVSTIKVDSLSKGETKSLNFKFLSTSGAVTKNYPVEITVNYSDDFQEKSTLNQFVGIFVNAPDSSDSSKGKPKLIIDKYVFEPQLVKAGENFEMKLSFFNTNSSKTVKNIKIFLTAEAGGTNPDSPSAGGSVFTPVDSSNTFYIDSIPPKGRVEKSITMFTVPDALAKTHTILANFEYEDNEGNPLEDQERIGVPVVQQSKLETSELTIYPGAMVGQPMPVSLEFYNTGKVTLYNMMVKLDGDFQTENGSYYVGNFTSGSSEYFEGMVIPDMPGELTGAVLFTYEDSTGQMQEIRKEFTMDVMEMPPMDEFPEDFYPPMNDMNQGGIKGIVKSKWLWIGIVALGAIIGGVVFYKKKKREKEMALDE